MLLRIGPQGYWTEVTAGVRTPPAVAEVVPGALLPGLVNAHSQAFQRAFAGLAERRDSEADDFWSWRDRMYRVALRITPAQLRAVAAQLYLELLQGGYAQVCEFHSLHHQPDGLVFSSSGPAWRDVRVAGQWTVRAHQHAHATRIPTAFTDTMAALWEDE